MMSISQINPTIIVKQRVANFLIAALCYLLLFVFIFNVKAAVIDIKESGSVLFVSSEMLNNNNELNPKIETRNMVEKLTPHIQDNKVLPPKPKIMPRLKPVPVLMNDFTPQQQSIGVLTSLNIPNNLEIGIPTMDNNFTNVAATSVNSKPAPPNGAIHSHENSKNEVEAAKSQYIERIITRIERKKTYPSRARELMMEGVVVISMKISRNGVLSAVRVVKSSKIQMLDDAALNAVKNAAPFEKFPEIIDNDSLSIETPIEFEIKV